VEAGYRVVFEPRARAWDTAATAAGEFQRKVRTLAGNLQLVSLQPALLDPRRNRLWWQFLSHKIARLGVPWALLALLVTSLALGLSEGTLLSIYAAAALALFASLVAGLAGWLLETRGKRSRLLSMAGAFLLLNAAAAWALFQFGSGRSRVTWKAGSGSP
jgi:hypothetical protein